MTDKQQNVILRKALEDVVQKLGEMPGWRKVEDGLPLSGYGVIVNCDGCPQYGYLRIFPKGYTGKAAKWRLGVVGRAIGRTTDAVTHWQPLPAAPSDSTLAETLQAICASALGEIEVGDE